MSGTEKLPNPDPMPYLLTYYVEKVCSLIEKKYNFSPMECVRKFILSETYRMLSDESLEMWDFSPFGIFDMWEAEQITGNPRTSVYIRCES